MEKVCPLLELCGIKSISKGRNVCEKCPLQQCVFEYAGHVTRGDRGRLEAYYYIRITENGDHTWWKD